MALAVVKPETDPNRTVYVTLKDRRTGRSRCTTLYGVTVSEAMAMIRRAAEQDHKQPPSGAAR